MTDYECMFSDFFAVSERKEQDHRNQSAKESPDPMALIKAKRKV